MTLRRVSAILCLLVAATMFAVGGLGGVVIGTFALVWAALMLWGPER